MKSFTISIALLMVFAALNADAAEKSGRLEGTIVSRNAAKNELTVAHGDVAGVMGAMTMPYEVRGQRVTSLPNDGAKIIATLHESNGSYWLTDVKPAGGQEMAMPQQSMPQQHEHAPATGMSSMPGMNMSGMGNAQHGETHMAGMNMQMASDPTSDLLMRQASGTSMNPAAAPEPMWMSKRGDWTLMAHGLAFVNQVIQSGPRGGDKLFSTNWLMGMADRPLGGGHLMFRTMLSLEPLTVGKKYPELFQTGETIANKPIIDAQHPHDFFMELAVEYAHPLGGNTIGYLYAAPMGDPSLGPVAYPHRASASEMPQGALSHHVQDSTHIAGSVVTAGAQRGAIGFSVSGFHGREPDEYRWDLDTGRLDSWAARFTYDPSPNWTAQISTGHLKHPEALEPGNIQRTTASVAYSNATALGQWDSSLIFGHNKKSEGHATSAWVAESVLHFGRNYATGRAEIVDKDELFADQDVPPAIANGVFRIRALTLGYSRDVLVTHSLAGAIGVNTTLYAFPSAIKPYYGSPHSYYVFIRLRGGTPSTHSMHSMQM